MKFRGGSIAIVLGLVAGVLAVTVMFASKSLPSFARRMLIETLEERFQSTVEVGEVHFYGVAPVTIGARYVVMRYRGRKDLPPLMTIDRLTASADLLKQWGPTWRVSHVHMEGLHISIPAHSEEMERAGFEHQKRQKLQLTADNALLQILPRQKDRKPRSFLIHNVVLRSLT